MPVDPQTQQCKTSWLPQVCHLCTLKPLLMPLLDCVQPLGMAKITPGRNLVDAQGCLVRADLPLHQMPFEPLHSRGSGLREARLGVGSEVRPFDEYQGLRL
jgi:hypothetical protein